MWTKQIQRITIVFFIGLVLFSCSFTYEDEEIFDYLSPYLKAISEGNRSNYEFYYSPIFVDATNMKDWNEYLININDQFGSMQRSEMISLTKKRYFGGANSGTTYFARVKVEREEKTTHEQISIFKPSGSKGALRIIGHNIQLDQVP